jgi:hypothetical protein
MKDKVIISFFTLSICFFSSCCNKNSSVENDKTDNMSMTTDSILHTDSINYSLNENLEKIFDCKSQDKGKIRISWYVEEVAILPAIQKDNRLFRVSNDSICSVIFDAIKEDNLDYKQGEKILECFIEMDTLGNIIHIDMLSYPKNDFAKKCENIFRKYSPLNPFYYPELGVYGSVVNLSLNFSETRILMKYFQFDTNLY